jgi:hypothetical protein
MSWSRMRAVVGVDNGYQGQHPRSGAITACDGDEPIWDGLIVQRRRADYEAAAIREDHHGKLGRRDRTFR